MPSRYRHSLDTNSRRGSWCPGGQSGSGRTMPFGLPVVPDEYSIAVPSDSSGIGVSGRPFVASSRLRIRTPSPGPSTTSATSTFGHCFSASMATARFSSEKISTLDSLLLTM